MQNKFKLLLIAMPVFMVASKVEVKEDVYVRQAPSIDSKIIKSYPKGTKIKFTKNFGSWYKVENGFLFVENIKKEKQADNLNNEITDKKISYIKYFEELNIYEKDNFNSKQIDKLNFNTILEVECETRNISNSYPWYKTSRGYLSSPYLYNPKILKSCEEDKKILVVVEKPVVKPLKVEKKPKKVDKPKVAQVSKVKPKKIIKAVQKPKVEGKKDFFAGVVLGVNALSVNSENKTGSVTINSPLDESGYSFNIHVGAKYDENYRIIVNYDYIPVDDVTLQNYYLSVNYQWNRFLNPYVGLSSGISLLNWESDPLTNTTSKDTDSEASGFIGIQSGIEYKYDKDYSFISQLLYQEFFHKTKIVDGSNEAEITHDRVFQFGLGMRYSF